MTPTSTTVPASQNPESALTEFDAGYYGWRVVLAACLGVMAGFGSLFVYTFTVFVKPLGTTFGWSREAVSSRLRPRRHHARPRLSAARPLARPLRTSPHHPPVHGRLHLRHRLAFSAAPRHMAVLRHLHRARSRRQWRRASGLFALHLHLVPAPLGYGPCLRDGGCRLGRDDSPRVRASHHQPRWMARCLSFPRRSCAAARLAAQLASTFAIAAARALAPLPLNIPASPGSRACVPMPSGSSLRYCSSAPSA